MGNRYSTPNPKVFIKKSSTFKKTRRFNVKALFKRKSSPKQKTYVNTNVRKKKFIALILIILVAAIITLGGYLSIKYIQNLRDRSEEEVLSFGNVIGIPNVPTYPQSEFIFENERDDESVKRFLSLGNSVYRLLGDSDIQSVFEYYKEVLPNNGWTHVLSVPLTSEEKMYGEYWIAADKGLRIYGRINDIWYEVVSIKEAQTGLEDRVKAETARKLLLLTSDRTDLLPNFPWQLSFPSEYLTKYYSTEIGSLQGVSFKRIGADNYVYIEPVGYYGAISDTAFINKYLTTYNKKNKAKWKVDKTLETKVNNVDALSATISYGNQIGAVTLVKNISNSVMYCISSFTNADPFYEYILGNAKFAQEK